MNRTTWDDDVLLDLVSGLGEGEVGGRDGAGAYRALTRLLAEQRPADAVRWTRLEAPSGPVYLAGTDRGLARVCWTRTDEDAFVEELERRWPGRPVVGDPGALADAGAQVREYLAGQRETFDLEVDLEDLPAFQRDVLEAVRRVPFGKVVPYAELARRIRRPRAHRAVGNALGRNPVAIVVPCHRVVRSDGSLGGYSGGLEYKRRLLRLEGRGDLAPTG